MPNFSEIVKVAGEPISITVLEVTVSTVKCIGILQLFIVSISFINVIYS